MSNLCIIHRYTHLTVQPKFKQTIFYNDSLIIEFLSINKDMVELW